jgi:LVIVD repeat
MASLIKPLVAAGATLLLVTTLILLAVGPGGPEIGRQAGAQAPAAASAPAPPSSATCEECHKGIEPMHESPTVKVTCTQCHGGDGTQKDKEKSHVLPRDAALWKTSANPGSTYGRINLESPEFIRFMNPGDLRVADKSCGGASTCHGEIVVAVRRSVMATNPMVYHAGLYNNGVEPSKIPMYGEAFAPREKDGKVYFAPANIKSVGELTPRDVANGVLKELFPVPRFEISVTNDPFRILERGNTAASTRGPGTEAKISGVVLTISKTRLNDPGLWLQGPNEVGGDFRQSGCAACHVVYANDREEANSAHFAEFGNRGLSFSADPTIPKNEPGHPIKHRLTRRIPSAQCMSCHHHQGNGALGMYQGYLWWDQESDYDRVVKLGMGYPWWDPAKKVLGVDPPYKPALGPDGQPVMADLALHNKDMQNVQFGDAHGHAWHFVRVYKRDRYGRLLDGQDRVVADSDPDRFQKALHLKDIHLEKGMDCIDCHGSADGHGAGDGKLYSQMRDAIAIACKDCHGTVTQRATLVTSGPTGGWDLARERTPFGQRWMQVEGDKIVQHSKMKEGLTWEVRQIVDSIDPANPSYNQKSARAHALRKDGSVGPVSSEENLAHKTATIECASCHAAWNTGCYGCHIAVRVNTKAREIHVADTTTRAYPDYFPQVIRADMNMLGISGGRQGSTFSPFRVSNPVIVSVTDRGRNVVVHEQPTISSPGFSGFAFTANPPHTIRTRETRDCEDCHVAKANDNNGWLAGVLGFGTNAANFVGDYAYVATGSSGVQAVRVVEGYEPKPVMGSWLHSVAYPADYQRFVAGGRRLPETHRAGAKSARSLARRGEFLFVADGPGGLAVYDIAQIANKSAAQRIIPVPFSPLGNRVRVTSTDATAVALASNTPMDLDRKSRPENQEQPVSPIFRYAFVTDSVEGLIVVDVNTFTDGNPVNNYISRATTFNPNGALTGARSITIAGNHAYISSATTGLQIVDIANPTAPRLVATVGAPAVVEPRAVQVQFRYAFVVDREGLTVVDVTNPEAPRATPARVAIADARDVFVMRSYAYVAAGAQGLAIVDVERPEAPGAPTFFAANGAINDATGVTIGATYVGQYAYVADGKNGLRVVKLIDSFTPGYLGWSPAPVPELIASVPTAGPALSIAEGYRRDRAVDEAGNQIGISNRLGAHPFNAKDLTRTLKVNNELITVENSTPRVRR